MTANSMIELSNFCLKIETEMKATLRLIKNDFQSNGISFNDGFKDHFVQTTNAR